MEYRYFPITLAQLTAATRFHDLGEGSFAIGDVRVVTQYLNHPALSMGYRVEADGGVVVYSADHEPHAPHHPEGVSVCAGDARALWVHQEDRRHVEFLAGADLVIHDAQYTVEEYRKKVGWGHGPAEWAVDYAVAAGAKRLALFHHDPLRDDLALDRLVETCRQRAATASGGLEVLAAAEGQVLDVSERAVAMTRPVSPAEPAREPPVTSPGPQAVLIVDDDPDIVRLLLVTLRSEGFRLLTASDGEAALRIARTERPALILLDWQMPGLNGIEVTRALRADLDPFFREVPVVLITAQTGAEHTAAGFSAGVTDYLTKPFRPAHIRARVHAWLLRRAAGSGSNP
jgi:CheY-like chemotaxis protein